MSRKITFPVVSKGVRRNSETGVEIRSTKVHGGGMEHSVYVPDRKTANGYRLWDYFNQLSNARAEAEARVEMQRDEMAFDRSEAITENAERALAASREQLDSTAPLGMDEDPEIAAEVAEANGLDPEDAAEMTEHARKQFPSVAAMVDREDDREAVRIIASIPAHLRTAPDVAEMIKFAASARTPADSRKFAEAARDLAGVTEPAIDVPAPIDEGDHDVPANDIHNPPLRSREQGMGTVWTNVETGIEISKYPGRPYVVGVPLKREHIDVAEIVAETPSWDVAYRILAETVVAMRATIRRDEAEAYGEGEVRTDMHRAAEDEADRGGAICIEATCGTCGEIYNPQRETDEHLFREDGTECGGSPTNVGAYYGVPPVTPGPASEQRVTEYIGLQVQFRPEFSADLIGLTFEVDALSRLAAEEGYRFVGLRIRMGGRWRYRLAKLTDLRALDGRHVVAADTDA